MHLSRGIFEIIAGLTLHVVLATFQFLCWNMVANFVLSQMAVPKQFNQRILRFILGVDVELILFILLCGVEAIIDVLVVFDIFAIPDVLLEELGIFKVE